MSKYEPLWHWIRKNAGDGLTLTWDEVETIAGVGLDHSFLTYKKELESFGYRIEKISMKEKTVRIKRLGDGASA